MFLILLPCKVLLTRSCNGVPSSTIGDQVLSVWSRATCGGNLPHGIAGWSWRLVAGAVYPRELVSDTLMKSIGIAPKLVRLTKS